VKRMPNFRSSTPATAYKPTVVVDGDKYYVTDVKIE